MNLLFISNYYKWSNILYLYKYLPPCHQNIRYSFYDIQLCVPISSHYKHSCRQHISAIYKNIYYSQHYYYYYNNKHDITITRLNYKSSIILYNKSYAILGLVTSFHPCTIKRDNIFYKIAWDGVVHLTC